VSKTSSTRRESTALESSQTAASECGVRVPFPAMPAGDTSTYGVFNMVEQSIEIGTQWVVFEPNDQKLWKRITRDLNAFMMRLWRQGALFGASPEQAFYVKCDNETNPPEVIDAGQLIVEIGMCPVKPAEFVIFRIGQMPAGGDVSE